MMIHLIRMGKRPPSNPVINVAMVLPCLTMNSGAKSVNRTPETSRLLQRTVASHGYFVFKIKGLKGLEYKRRKNSRCGGGECR